VVSSFCLKHHFSLWHEDEHSEQYKSQTGNVVADILFSNNRNKLMAPLMVSSSRCLSPLRLADVHQE